MSDCKDIDRFLTFVQKNYLKLLKIIRKRMSADFCFQNKYSKLCLVGYFAYEITKPRIYLFCIITF